MLESPSVTDPPRRRRFGFRFSLRTFLIGVTLFCIALAWQLHRAKEQREAAAAIRAAGGWVHYDYQFTDLKSLNEDPNARPWEPAWLLRLVGIDFFHDVVSVNLVYNGDGPERQDNSNRPTNIAPHLAHFPRLRILLMSGPWIDDAGMQQVGNLRSLETLYQWDGQHITDAGVAHLRGMPRLRYIHLGSSQVGDNGIAALATLPSLEGLVMQRNRITDAGLAHLAGHPKLKELWIGNIMAPSPISDAGVVHLAKIPNLEQLDLQHTQVTPKGLQPLQAMPKLRSLLLDESQANDLDAVGPMFPNCKVDARRRPATNAAPADAVSNADPPP
jgi:internalin A